MSLSVLSCDLASNYPRLLKIGLAERLSVQLQLIPEFGPTISFAWLRAS